VNCTGVFSDKIRKMDDENSENMIVAVEGSHLIFKNSLCNPKVGLLIPKTEDG